MTTKEAWEIYRAKAPVHFFSLNRSKINRACRVLTEELVFTVDERAKLAIALDHARTGEGRSEFDKICTEIDKRLKGNKE